MLNATGGSLGRLLSGTHRQGGILFSSAVRQRLTGGESTRHREFSMKVQSTTAPSPSLPSTEMLPHRQRAAARKAATLMPSSSPSSNTAEQPEETYPTFVPRNQGVTDGPWDRMDALMVREAEADAEKAALGQRQGQGQQGVVILGMSVPELEDLAVRYSQPKYRGKQLYDAVLNGAKTIGEISTVPAGFRSQLMEDGVKVGRSLMHHSVEAKDGTRKFLLQLSDGRLVETVGIPNEDASALETNKQPLKKKVPTRGQAPFQPSTVRMGAQDEEKSKKGRKRLTVCVSSQVGCPMRCSFCATGKGGFARNLTPHEIMDQVLTVQEQFKKRVSHIVMMGMGEPLLNLPSVVKAYHLLNEQMGIGARSITISTVGVPNAIQRLAHADLKSTLAVSIHAPNQQLREQLIPSAKAYPLKALMEDCKKYYKLTGRRVTFEYTLLSGINDLPEHAKELAALLKSYDMATHVNLIPWNPVDESEFERPGRRRIMGFVKGLEEGGVTATIRVTRGLEASAACGQLRNQHQKIPLPDFLQTA